MSALSFSMINFIVTVGLYHLVRRIFSKTTVSRHSWAISMPFILLLVALSVVNGWLYAKAEERGITYRAAGTTRSSGERTWITVFRSNTISWKSFVRVTLSNGTVYGGWPEDASETESDELFIRPAFIIRPNRLPEKLDGEGILVFGKDLVSVEFVHDHPSKWKPK